jgi:hypothetical protein
MIATASLTAPHRRTERGRRDYGSGRIRNLVLVDGSRLLKPQVQAAGVCLLLDAVELRDTPEVCGDDLLMLVSDPSPLHLRISLAAVRGSRPGHASSAPDPPAYPFARSASRCRP